MPSLKEQAQTIRNETQAGANTPERIGQFMEESAEVTETVDTIADLRALEGVQDNDIVRVRSHSTSGLNRELGGGLFVFRTTPLFSINNVGGYTAGTGDITTTPTTTGFALPAHRDYESQFPEVVFDNGVTGKIRQTEAIAGDRLITVPTGSTSFNIVLDGDVPDGASAYYADDDGVRIRPANAGFNGQGYYQRILYDNICSPEMYGAIPNHSSFDGAINECSAAIQKAFDSPWNVRLMGGAYYISSPIVAERGKSIYMPRAYPTESFFDNRRSKLNDEALSSIYITTNIDMIIVRCTDLKWEYGLLDTRQAPSTNEKAAFRYDMSSNVSFSDLNKPAIIGDFDHLLTAENAGITAVLVDIKNAITDSNVVNSLGIGSIYYTYIDIVAECINTGYWVSEKPLDPNYNYFTNSVRVNMISMRNKRTIYMESSQGSSFFTGHIQAHRVLLESQKDWPHVTLWGGDQYYDMFAFDLGSSTDVVNGLYINSRATDFSKAGVRLGVQATKNGQNSNCIQSDSLDSIDFGSNKVASSHGYPSISRLTNALSLPVQRGATYSYGAYNATGVDLETTLGSSSGLPIATNVDINDSGSLFDLRNNKNLEVEFKTGADLENDFVELELTGLDGALWSEEMYVDMQFFNNLCNKIQVITGVSGGAFGQQTIDVTGVFSNLNRFRKIYKFSSDDLQFGFNVDTLRVRFIGMDQLGTYEISELISFASGSQNLPYIHAQGGQKIYGSLEIEEINYTDDTSLGDNKTIQRGLEQNKFTVTRPITSAEILSLNTSPLEFISEEDAEALTGVAGNPAVIPIRAYIKSVSGSTDYATNTNLIIRDNNSSAGKKLELSISSINDGYVYSFSKVGNALHRRFNGGLVLAIETGDPTGGDKSFELVVEFEIVL